MRGPTVLSFGVPKVGGKKTVGLAAKVRQLMFKSFAAVPPNTATF